MDGTPTRRLPPRWRKLLLTTHIGSSVGLLGLLTPWGLFRHWWVLAKFGLTTAGAVLSLVVLTPALTELAEATGPIPLGQRLELVRDSGAASLVLVTTLLLSVYKPFGRIRAAARAGSGRPPS